MLVLWPGRWLVPVDVRGEATQWKAERDRVLRILDDLSARRIVVYTGIDPHREGPLFAKLSRTLGQGESAAIAVAHQRRLGVALDDHAARRACERLNPPVTWIATEEVLLCAATEGRLTLDEARGIWTATGIADPRRQIL